MHTCIYIHTHIHINQHGRFRADQLDAQSSADVQGGRRSCADARACRNGGAPRLLRGAVLESTAR